MRALLEKNREKLNRDLRDARRRRLFSPAMYSADSVIEEAIRSHVRGKVLDVGCGDMSYRELLLAYATEYDSLDIERRAEGITFIADVHDMHAIATGSYDSAVCFAILEHARNPFRAVQEIARVLKPGGRLILSVPHLSRLHEEPHDYFRYTKYGIRVVLEAAGLRVMQIAPAGGLFCFLGHQFATLFVCLFWSVPILREIVFWINHWVCVRPCFWLDKVLDKSKVMALGYVCVARKEA